MRYSILAVLALLGSLLIPAAADAQRLKKIKITDVRVGYKSGFDQGDVPDSRWQYLFKAGQWTPIFVDLEAGDEGFTRGELTVEVTDSDDVQNNYVVAVPPLQPRESYTALTFTKPGGTGSEIVVTVRNDRESDRHQKVYESVPLEDLLFLAAGSHLTGLKQSLANEVKQAEGGTPQNAGMGSSINHGRVAYLDGVALLPTRWFAYAPVDLLIISTSKTDFVNDLINRGEQARQDALSEWVRRGGRLVVSAGRNHDLAAALFKALHMQALPVEFVPGGMQLRRLGGVESWVGGAWKQRLENLPPKPGDKVPPLEVAKLKVKPGQEAEVLIDGPQGNEGHPLLVRVPYGLVQVTLLAFDVDQPPFTRWDGQSDFWKRLRTELGVALSKSADNNPRGGFRAYGQPVDNDLAGQLRNALEQFPEVSNISFGWVALFIFIYILVVGPLDYLFLKKVVKRLELTWVTFPAVVLVVSTVSYFTAYALKGNDLLINKADLVDIDQASQTVSGHTWFTVFSPRIQHYTVGVEPAAPARAGAPADDKKAASVVVSWMGRPDASYGGFGRPRSQSLFRRAYNYAPDAQGLEGVPIQVWSMKSFTASWERPLDKPAFTADIQPPKINHLQGTITSHLPATLDHAYLIYAGGRKKDILVYALDQPLKPNEAVHFDLTQPRGLQNWAVPFSGPANANRNAPVPVAGKEDVFRRLLFHEKFPSVGGATNVSLRCLDASWRLDLKNEIILFGRLAPQSAPAEAVTNDPASPTRLWLGKLPAAGAKRPELLGNMAQDTYVRAFLPVKADANP
jgi:hypothetical protein